VIPGAQAQVDGGDEGAILAHASIPKVNSFHMVLSYSQDPFCCFTNHLAHIGHRVVVGRAATGASIWARASCAKSSASCGLPVSTCPSRSSAGSDHAAKSAKLSPPASPRA
jgi:hypothetical protein